MSDEFTSIDDARERLGKVGYLADEPAALVSYLAGQLGKPVLVEGPAGVGKTELAKAVSRVSRPMPPTRAGRRSRTTSSARTSCSPARC